MLGRINSEKYVVGLDPPPVKQSYHRGRAETAYRQCCPSCSRQHSEVNVFCLGFACYWT